MTQKFHHLFLVFCLCCSVLTASAQSSQQKATTLLQQASEAYKNSRGVLADFRILSKDESGSPMAEIEGKISLQDSRFYIEVPDEMKAWFDGRDLWTLIINAQEVNLSTPGPEELLMLNPVNVFMLYEHDYQCQALSDKTLNGKSCCGVAMRPEDKNADIQSIEVYFDKSNLHPQSIQIVNSNRSSTIITILKYQTNRNYPDYYFLFPQKDYPMVEVIDLR